MAHVSFSLTWYGHMRWFKFFIYIYTSSCKSNDFTSRIFLSRSFDDVGLYRHLSVSKIDLCTLSLYMCLDKCLVIHLLGTSSIPGVFFILFFFYVTSRFTLSAVSPAVLVPSLERLKNKGFGEAKGVNTLMLAASSLDDIVSISAVGILLSTIFSEGD